MDITQESNYCPLCEPFRCRDCYHRLDVKGRAPARELIERRKEIRHMISELVHQTDARGGIERIPRILELGASLMQQITSEEKR